MHKLLLMISILLSSAGSLCGISIDHIHDHGDVTHVVQVTSESARVLEAVLKKGAVYTGSVLCGALGLRIIYAMIKNKNRRTYLIGAAVAGSFLAACGLFYTAAYLL
jgi:tetrahydromethanopterin S-methyltransferase subunit A